MCLKHSQNIGKGETDWGKGERRSMLQGSAACSSEMKRIERIERPPAVCQDHLRKCLRPSLKWDESYSLAVRFARPATLYEKLVSGITSGHTHVDIVLHKPGTSYQTACYSTYVGEKFSMNLMSKDKMRDTSYDNLVLNITEKELDCCVDYLSKMCSKVPYNYSDSMILLPMVPHRNLAVDTIVQDVPLGVKPENLSSVFCSQAALLVCRECLDPQGVHQGMLMEMNTINSRLVSPRDLYVLLQKYAAPVSNEDFFFRYFCDVSATSQKRFCIE